jgi:hypothetical protein
MAPRDDRYRSGEHHAPADSTDELVQLSTIGALAAEVRAVRRESRMQLKHIDDRIDTFLTQMRDVSLSLQQGREHCASHDSAITAINKRVDRLEKVETYGKATSANPTQHQHWASAIANSPLAPWIILLILLILFLAAGTGRDASSFNPFKSSGEADPAPASREVTPAAVMVTP